MALAGLSLNMISSSRSVKPRFFISAANAPNLRVRRTPSVPGSGPELGQEAVLRSDLANHVRTPALERIPVIELDVHAQLRGFLHLLDGHLARNVRRMGRDQQLHTRRFGFPERQQCVFRDDVA